MKSIFLASFFVGLALAPAVAKGSEPVEPAEASDRPRIEVCFVLDTTGSMGGLIDGAKRKIWSIANQVVAAKPTPLVRFGLVAYRDRGDEYVTRLTPLTDDLDAVYADLQKLVASGGGDGPESVSQALHEAVNRIEWSRDRSVLKIIYLVGDAPPHTDYKDGPDYLEVCRQAVKGDLIINTVQCGAMEGTREVWTEIARRAEGSYVALPQSGNMVVVDTPFDERLGELNREIGATLIGYGSAGERAGVMAKQEAVELAAFSVAADRLAYNSASGKSVQGGGELIDAINEGRVDADKLDRAQLPEEWGKLSDDEIKARIAELKAKRGTLQAEVAELSRKRADYIAEEQKRLAAEGQGDSFDEKVAETVREQAMRKGIRYE
jgi:Mg-chelatase subunit ChlD